MRNIKVLVADDQPIFVEGLKKVLCEATHPRFEVVATADNGTDVLRLSRKKAPDLVLLELKLPRKDGLDVISQLRLEKKDTKIIVLTCYSEAKLVKMAFKFGADGYILKNQPTDELFIAIQDVMGGNNFLGAGLILHPVNGRTKTQTQLGDRSQLFEDRFIKKHHLTKREIEILQLITEALSNKEIAKTLFISDQTVSVHRKNIMRKLGVSNTAGLLKMAYDYSLV